LQDLRALPIGEHFRDVGTTSMSCGDAQFELTVSTEAVTPAMAGAAAFLFMVCRRPIGFF
jgi:hypothetical protein